MTKFWEEIWPKRTQSVEIVVGCGSNFGRESGNIWEVRIIEILIPRRILYSFLSRLIYREIILLTVVLYFWGKNINISFTENK